VTDTDDSAFHLMTPAPSAKGPRPNSVQRGNAGRELPFLGSTELDVERRLSDSSRPERRERQVDLRALLLGTQPVMGRCFVSPALREPLEASRLAHLTVSR
jgi:hypothetical protein